MEHNCETPDEKDFEENDLWICGECNIIWGLRYICISGPKYVWMTADDRWDR